MSLIIYLIVLLLTGFVAGIFRYHPLIVLFIGEILLAIFMLLQVFLSGLLLKLKLQGSRWVVQKGKEGSGVINIENRSPFPLNRFSLKGYTAYKDGRQRENFLLKDCLDLKTTSISFPLSGKYAGLKNLSLSRFVVWDLLSLFPFTRRLKEKITVSVLPTKKAMKVEFSQATLALIESNKQINDPSQSRDEFRQVREYAYGDAWRDVDWHKSAKADKLMVREYDREEESFVDLELDGKGYHSKETEVLDKYYDLLSALIRGFLADGITLRITRVSANGSYRPQHIIRNESDIEEFFVDLYHNGIFDPQHLKAEDKSPHLPSKNYLRFDLDCRLMMGSKVLYHFNMDNPEEDIDSRLIVL